MTCKDCRATQAENRQGRNMAYLAVIGSNVLIGACDKHFNLIRHVMGMKAVTDQEPVKRLDDVDHEIAQQVLNDAALENTVWKGSR